MAARYRVTATRSFERDFKALPLSIRKIIAEALSHLEREPFGPAPKVKKLRIKGAGRWRLRVGVYRVRYDVIKRDVVLHRVRHRKDSYR